MDTKKLIIIVVVVFLGFWMLNEPAGLADVVRDGAGGGWGLTTDLFSGVIDFFGEI